MLWNMCFCAWGSWVSDRDLSPPHSPSSPTCTHRLTLTHPLCLHGGALPREQCWTHRNLCPDFQRFSHIAYMRGWTCWARSLRAVTLSQALLQQPAYLKQQHKYATSAAAIILSTRCCVVSESQSGSALSVAEEWKCIFPADFHQ